MKQSGHLNPREETGTGCPVTSKYGRTPPIKHGGVGRQKHTIYTASCIWKQSPLAQDVSIWTCLIMYSSSIAVKYWGICSGYVQEAK